jgi:NADPH:quinone reductase-like Zn-dependent oxidoreductase
MTRTRKIFGTLAIVLAVVITALALFVSHDSPCAAATPLAKDATAMKAIVYRCYGSPDVLLLEDVERPVPLDNELLVKVHAAAINPLDWHYMRGKPYIMRAESGFGAPKVSRMGVDFAGVVEAVGKDVTRFRPGDEVFGGRTGAFSEYVRVREDRAVTAKPANVTFEQAAAVPIAALTALQALRDKGRLQAGQKVLINGASGGVGTFAVQIAKAYGAEVSGVCSTRNVEMVRSIGADRVFDYTREDFMESGERYDVILDNVGNRPLLDYRRVLKPKGVMVIIGGPDGAWIGPMVGPIKAVLVSPFVEQEFGMILAEMNPQDLTELANLMSAGKVTPVIDRTYALNEVPQAIGYLETGRARGKVVIRVNQGLFSLPER